MDLTKTIIDGVQVFTLTVTSEDATATVVRLKSIIRDHADFSRHGIMDLSHVDFLNSTALGGIVGAARLFREKGAALLLTGLGPRLVETFRIVRLDRVMPFRCTIEDAIRDIKSHPTATARDFVSHNPSLEDVKKEWARKINEETAGGSKTSALKKAAGTVRLFHSDNEDDIPTARVIQPVDIEEQTPDPQLQEHSEALRDWQQALFLFSRAQFLAQKYQLPFSPSMPFKDFLAELSGALSRTKSG